MGDHETGEELPRLRPGPAPQQLAAGVEPGRWRPTGAAFRRSRTGGRPLRRRRHGHL